MAAGDLVLAVDSTGRADLDLAKGTWRDVVARYARIGVELSRPVSLVIEGMPIMGATQSTRDGHRLHIAAHAVASGMLDGLMAHEMGHMVLTERRHPSHREEVHRLAMAGVDVPAGRRGFGGVAREAINHVQDVYADDLAIHVIHDDRRIAAFFSDWVRNSARPGPSWPATLGNGVSVAFALGNLDRHRIPPERGAEYQAQGFAASIGIGDLLDDLTRAYRDLPITYDEEPVERAIRDVLTAIAAVWR